MSAARNSRKPSRWSSSAAPARARLRRPCCSARPASRRSPTSPAACCAGARSASRSKAARTSLKVRTRFAPSPTGYLHIGGARTALFSWAYARRHGGAFVLRVEDTDLERSTQESVDAILHGLAWLGIDWDEGPFFQMQRLARYREVAEQLIAAGHAYYDYMSRDDLEQL